MKIEQVMRRHKKRIATTVALEPIQLRAFRGGEGVVVLSGEETQHKFIVTLTREEIFELYRQVK